MSAVKLTDGIYSVGIQNPNMRVFDIVMQTDSGTTYNSYIVRGSEKTALIETCHEGFFEQYVQNIQEVCDPKEIDYIVMNHNEPDHSGAMAKLLELMPNAKLVSSIAGANYLRNITNRCDLDVHKVKDGEEIDLGGKTLTFISAPNLHWPDSMMTYVKEEKLLLSNDGFGQHLASDGLFVNEQPLDLVVNEAKSYYANILFPYGAQAEKALNTAGTLGLDIEMIAPSHGCIWSGKDEVNTILGLYAKWASGKNEGKAVVVYDSMWGATAKMAETVMAEFQDAGIPVTKHCLAVENVSEVMVDFLDAAYVCIGNPTLNNQLFPRVAGFVTYMKGLAPRGKKALAFGSYGWKPGVVKQIQQVYEELGWQTVAPFEEKYTPKAEVLEQLKERVRELIKL